VQGHMYDTSPLPVALQSLGFESRLLHSRTWMGVYAQGVGLRK